jgi:hypothetical protein
VKSSTISGRGIRSAQGDGDRIAQAASQRSNTALYDAQYDPETSRDLKVTHPHHHPSAADQDALAVQHSPQELLADQDDQHSGILR